jgi:predicted MPP superfamily phosphohydrolase
LFPFFSLLQVALTAVTHWLVYRWARSVWPAVGRRRWLVAGSVAAIVGGSVLTRWLVNGMHSEVAARIHILLLSEELTVGFAALPILLWRAVTFAVARAATLGRAAPAPAAEGPGITRRQLADGIGGMALLGATGSVLGWGVVRGRHAFELAELPVRIPGLPRALDGYTMVQLSDIHVGAVVGDRELAEGLELVAKARPDLVVVTGDLLDFDPAYAPLVARALAGAAGRDGIYAILGNHDYYAGARKLLAALRAAGVGTLMNEGVRIRAADAGGFALLGVDDLWAARRGGHGPDLSSALAGVPGDAPRILLSHQPSTVELWPGRVALQLSGHTHGGQINPGFRPADLLLRYVSGPYEVGGTMLYVNRGFGTAGPPSRVGAPPEVTRIVLVSA